MLEIVTLGGGQHIVNVLNAVSAWCGGGGFRSMLQVVMVMGLIYALLIMALALNWKAALNWFLTATAMYMCLIVPTTNVVVIDKVNPVVGNGSVSNVPIGLAAMASFSSQVSYWLTRTAEAVFVEPGALTLTQYGMLYPTRINELSRQFVIANPVLKQNVEAYITQCWCGRPSDQGSSCGVATPEDLIGGSDENHHADWNGYRQERFSVAWRRRE